MKIIRNKFKGLMKNTIKVIDNRGFREILAEKIKKKNFRLMLFHHLK